MLRGSHALITILCGRYCRIHLTDEGTEAQGGYIGYIGLIQGYIAIKGRKQNLTPGILVTDSVLLTTTLGSLIVGIINIC